MMVVCLPYVKGGFPYLLLYLPLNRPDAQAARRTAATTQAQTLPA